MKYFIGTLLIVFSVNVYANSVDIKTTSLKRVIVKNSKGKSEVKWVKPSKVVPKDIVKIVNRIINDTNNTLNNLKVTNPIDSSLEFQKGSVESKMKMKKLFSVNGKTFKRAKELFIIGKDKKKHLARAKDYRAVQFIIDKVAPNSKEIIEFLAKIK